MKVAGDADGEQAIPDKDTLSFDKNAADAKLENTSLSTGVFITVFVREQPVPRRLVFVYMKMVYEIGWLIIVYYGDGS